MNFNKFWVLFVFFLLYFLYFQNCIMCATCKLNTWSKNKINSNYLFLRTNSATFAKFSVRIELFENTLTCFLKISGLYPGDAWVWPSNITWNKKWIFWYFSDNLKFGKKIVNVLDVRHSWFQYKLKLMV